MVTQTHNLVASFLPPLTNQMPFIRLLSSLLLFTDCHLHHQHLHQFLHLNHHHHHHHHHHHQQQQQQQRHRKQQQYHRDHLLFLLLVN